MMQGTPAVQVLLIQKPYAPRVLDSLGYVRNVGATGSNPVTSTEFIPPGMASSGVGGPFDPGQPIPDGDVAITAQVWLLDLAQRSMPLSTANRSISANSLSLKSRLSRAPRLSLI